MADWNNYPTFPPPFGSPPTPMSLPPRGAESSFPCQGEATRALLPHELYPWIYPPPGFQPFRSVGVIDTPAVATPTVVLQIQSPSGWDGVVLKLANVFTGGGFFEGSGDLVWSVAVDLTQPVKNFGALTTTVGTIPFLEDVPGGIILLDGRTLTYTVTNSNAGLIPGTKVICIFAGYWWRRIGGTY